MTQKQMEIGMKFFLHINDQVKGKNSREKFLTGSAQIFLYVCFSFRLSPRLNIDRRITKIGTNDWYHKWRTGLKIPYCQFKMAATKFSFFDISTSDRGDFPCINEIALFHFISLLL